MPRNIVIVGGGLSGLAASIYLARAGHRVTIFEKRRALGGRAVTHLRQGFRFNLGAHALYRTGAASAVYRELGIPVPGRVPKPKAIALFGGDEYRLPTGFLSLFTTGLLPLGAKLELTKLLWRVRRRGGKGVESLTVRDWLDANVSHERARDVLLATIRLATYSAHDTQSASYALNQMRLALRGGVIYVDEGWQRIVDSMHSTAVTSGVNFVSSSRIVGVHHDGNAVKSVELGGLEMDADRMDTMSVALPEERPDDVEGARIPANTVLLAVDPVTASELVEADFANEWTRARPVTAACLDVGLRSLPEPKNTFALGIDAPVYLSVHSSTAQLAPKGGALIHLVKYRTEQTATNEELDGERARRSSGSAVDEHEMESLLDRFQEGWRDVLVHRRFLPAMTVSNALATPDVRRPAPVTPLRGLYIAGDWVGDEGVLSDAALSSSRAAAKAILASPD